MRTAFPHPKVPVFKHWRLRECDYGDMTGLDPDLLERTEHIDAPYPSGESGRQAVERVRWFVRDLEPRWHGSRLLVVGHVATWRGLERQINGTPLKSLVAAPFEWQEGWEYRVG